MLGIGAHNRSTAYSVISGTSGRITKAGSGSLELSGGDSYTGPTSVQAGTLLVTGTSMRWPGGAVTVASSAALGGTGKLRGATTVSGGIATGSRGG